MRLPAPPHLVLAAYCAGLCLALVLALPLWTLLGVAGGSVLATVLAGRATPGRRVLLVPWAGLTVFFLLVGLGVGQGRLAALGESSLAGRIGHTVDLRAVLVDLPAIDADTVTLALHVRAADGAPVDEPAHLRLRLDEGQRLPLEPCGPLSEGAVLTASAVRVETLPPAEEGRFDYGRYLRRKGEHVVLEGRLADVRLIGRRGGLQGLVDQLRVASRRHLATGLHPPVREVLQGMVLGDDEGVGDEFIDDFRRSGLLHIMAVSGENVVLLCSMWSFAFVLLRIPRLTRTALLLPVVACYVLLTGASPSIVRAGIAGICGLLAVMASRPADGWLVWLVPAAWLLTVNPNTLFDASFQLSFGAVAGLLVLARPLTRAVAFLPGPLPEQVGVTTAASISTAPVSMLTFGSMSAVAVPANVAGGFVLGPIMFLGMLSLLLGFVSPWLSLPLNLLAGLFIGFLLGVTRFFGDLPFAVWEWHGPSPGLLVATVLALETAVVVWSARREQAPLLRWLRARGRLLVPVTVALVVAAVLLAPAGARPPTRPTLTVLDVGEGAAALFQAPDGPTVLIDAGPEPLDDTLRRHAVTDIDLLVLSHGHADHTAGLGDVAGERSIGVALVPRPPGRDGPLEGVSAALRAAGVAVRPCTAPTRLAGRGWELLVLPTAPPSVEGGNQGENDCALVVLVRLGGEYVLLPGDAEGEALEDLDLPACAAVELPHHGSRGGIDDELLAVLAPRLALVSVGPNRYGHPAPEALASLAARGVPVLRTDRAGDIALFSEAGRLRVHVSDP